MSPTQMYIQEKAGKRSIVGRAFLDWDGKVIPNLLCTDTRRFFMPTLNNRSVNIYGGKLRCAALVYRTFTREVPTGPLLQCQFKTKDGDGLNFCVENLIIATQE